jgi:hypothetical protein
MGVPNHSFHGVTQAGAAFFYTRDANGIWSPAYQIWGGDYAGDAYEKRGTSVAMSKSSRYAVVGGPGGTASGQPSGSGVAYVVSRLDNGLVGSTQVISLAAGELGAHFGHAVAVEGDTIVIVAPNDDMPLLFGSATDARRVYVFERMGGQWVQTNRMTDPDNPGTFGNSVAVLNNNVVVGDEGDDQDGITNRSAAYAYRIMPGGPSDTCGAPSPCRSPSSRRARSWPRPVRPRT